MCGFLLYLSSMNLFVMLLYLFYFCLQEKAKGPENEIAKIDKLLSLVREPSEKSSNH